MTVPQFLAEAAGSKAYELAKPYLNLAPQTFDNSNGLPIKDILTIFPINTFNINIDHEWKEFEAVFDKLDRVKAEWTLIAACGGRKQWFVVHVRPLFEQKLEGLKEMKDFFSPMVDELSTQAGFDDHKPYEEDLATWSHAEARCGENRAWVEDILMFIDGLPEDETSVGQQEWAENGP